MIEFTVGTVRMLNGAPLSVLVTPDNQLTPCGCLRMSSTICWYCSVVMPLVSGVRSSFSCITVAL